MSEVLDHCSAHVSLLQGSELKRECNSTFLFSLFVIPSGKKN